MLITSLLCPFGLGFGTFVDCDFSRYSDEYRAIRGVAWVVCLFCLSMKESGVSQCAGIRKQRAHLVSSLVCGPGGNATNSHILGRCLQQKQWLPGGRKKGL